MRTNQTFDTLQARYDNATPYEPTSLEESHEVLTDSLTEISELLLQVELKVNEIHRRAGEAYCETHLPYLTFQLDTDTARNEIDKYLNNEDV